MVGGVIKRLLAPIADLDAVGQDASDGRLDFACIVASEVAPAFCI